MSENQEKTEIVWHDHAVQRERGCVVWLTGLSGSGKSTIANRVDELLHSMYEKRQSSRNSFVLDGDNVRHGLNASYEILAREYNESFARRFGLGFGQEDRQENIRRIGHVAEIFCSAGLIALTAFVSPYRSDRDRVRKIVEAGGQPGDFLEIFVDTPLEVCERRDPKGLYQKARAGEIRNFTGIDAPYEPPANPEMVLDGTQPVDELASRVINHLSKIEKLEIRS